MNSQATAAHQAVIVFRPVTQGYAVACRCGYGKWFTTKDEAQDAKACHLGDHDMWSGISGQWCIRCNKGL